MTKDVKNAFFTIGQKAGCFVSDVRFLMEKSENAGKTFGKSVKNYLNKGKSAISGLNFLNSKELNDKELSIWEEKRNMLLLKIGEEVVELGRSDDLVSEFISSNEKMTQLIQSVNLCDYEISLIKGKRVSSEIETEKESVLKQAISNLKSQDHRQRIVALRVIEKFGDKKTMPHLIELLDDPVMEIRERTVEVLQGFSRSRIFEKGDL